MLSKHSHNTRLFGAAQNTFLEAGRVLYWSLVWGKHDDPWFLSNIFLYVRGRKMHPSTLFSTQPLHTLSLIHCHSVLPLQSLTVTKAPAHSMLGIGRVLRLKCSKPNLCRLRLFLSCHILY